MSLANGAVTTRAATDTRAAVVAALETVEGVTAYPVVPDQAIAGAGWPKWVQTVFSGHLCATTQDTFDVFVTLPADYLAATVDEGDKLRDVLIPALVKVGNPSYCEPVQITFNDRQTVPAVRVRLVTR